MLAWVRLFITIVFLQFSLSCARLLVTPSSQVFLGLPGHTNNYSFFIPHCSTLVASCSLQQHLILVFLLTTLGCPSVQVGLTHSLEQPLLQCSSIPHLSVHTDRDEEVRSRLFDTNDSPGASVFYPRYLISTEATRMMVMGLAGSMADVLSQNFSEVFYTPCFNQPSWQIFLAQRTIM